MLFKHNFFVYYTLVTDLHSLSLPQTRELKFKITFPQINNQNFVVSAGQLKFLTEMSRVGTKDLLRNYGKSYRLVKLVITRVTREPNDATTEN